jgi:hypothetical protein
MADLDLVYTHCYHALVAPFSRNLPQRDVVVFPCNLLKFGITLYTPVNSDKATVWIVSGFADNSEVAGMRRQESPLNARTCERVARLYPGTANRQWRNKGARA